jgi:hypothetical protein
MSKLYYCDTCDYVTDDISKICLQGDGETELCSIHCGCNEY